VRPSISNSPLRKDKKPFEILESPALNFKRNRISNINDEGKKSDDIE